MAKKLEKKFIGDDQVGSSQILIEKNQSLRGVEQSDAVVDLLNLNITDEVLLKGVKVLNSSGMIPADILPSYVDDVLEYADLAAFPATGETGKIYVALDTNKCYRWSGSAYIMITSGAVDSVNGETGVVVLDAGDIEMVSLPGTSVETRLVDLESEKVEKTGDTMSGDLLIDDGAGNNAKFSPTEVTGSLDLGGGDTDSFMISGTQVQIAQTESSVSRVSQMDYDGVLISNPSMLASTAKFELFKDASNKAEYKLDEAVITSPAGTATVSSGSGFFHNAGDGQSSLGIGSNTLDIYSITDAKKLSFTTASGQLKLNDGGVTPVATLPVSDDDVAVKKYVDDEIAALELIATTPENQVVYVAKDGDDSTGNGSSLKPFLTVAAAQTAITDASSSKRYVIVLQPGSYVETAGFQLKDHCTYAAVGSRGSTDLRVATGDITYSSSDALAKINFINISVFAATGSSLIFNFSGSAQGVLEAKGLFTTSAMQINSTSSAQISAQFYDCRLGAITSTGNVGCLMQNSSSNNIIHGSASATSTQGFLSLRGAIANTIASVSVNAASVYALNSFYGSSWTLNDRGVVGPAVGVIVAGKFDFLYSVGSLPSRSLVSITGSNWTESAQNDVQHLRFSPAVSGDWNVVPSNPKAALDELASRIESAEGASAAIADDVANLVTLSGMPVDSLNLGAFTGSTIPDDQTIKQALQALETEVETKVSKAGDTMTGFLTLHDDPTSPLHAATKQYVDAVAEGLHVHAPARLIAAVDLGGTYNNGTAGVGAFLDFSASPIAGIDGVSSFAAGDRIIVALQNGSSLDPENGVYYIASAGDIDGNGDITKLTRAQDFDTPTEMAGGDFIFVQEGSLYADTGWVMTETVVTVGTTPVKFLQFSGAGSYSAGEALFLDGTEFNVLFDDSTIGLDGSNQLYVKDSGIGSDQIAADAVTKEKINSDVAGAGLAQALDGSLEVTAGDGIEVALDAVKIKLDGSSLAVSASGLKSNISWKKEEYAVTSTLTTGAFFDLAFEAEVDSISAWVDRLAIHEGASQDYTVSYTGGVGGVTRITFVNALVTPGQSQLSNGDTVFFKYQKKDS